MKARPALIALSASLLSVVGARAAPAGPQMTWGYTPASASGQECSLAYGEDGTDAVLAILRRRPGSGQVKISSFPEAARQGVIVRLRSGATLSRHRGHVEPNEAADGVMVETTAPTRDPALQGFLRGARLSIAIGRERIDLPAAPRALTARFLETCG